VTSRPPQSQPRLHAITASGTRFLCAAAVCAVVFLSGCVPSARERVILYCAQDQEYAEPILREFTRSTGIEVRALYDSEAVKTVGMANRLLAERSHPQCDVFWSNEEFRTVQLSIQGVFDEVPPVSRFGYRSRRMVINTNLVNAASVPGSLKELTNAVWKGRVAVSYPLFGSSASHFLALRQRWGHEAWMGWCRALAANKPFLVDGNSVVVKYVGRGEAAIGLTDSDDIAAEQKEGLPVAALPLDEDLLLIPNTVAVIRDGPHPAEARRLAEFLRGKETVARLAAVGAIEGVSSAGVGRESWQPDWVVVARELDVGLAAMKELFLR
jgi:iron(III) transport system substrate-binding protein